MKKQHLSQKITNIDEVKSHKVSEVICVKCGKRWIATRPEETLLKNIERTKCSEIGFAIETGETITN